MLYFKIFVSKSYVTHGAIFAKTSNAARITVHTNGLQPSNIFITSCDIFVMNESHCKMQNLNAYWPGTRCTKAEYFSAIHLVVIGSSTDRKKSIQLLQCNAPLEISPII